jgi:hypothetical protein
MLKVETRPFFFGQTRSFLAMLDDEIGTPIECQDRYLLFKA